MSCIISNTASLLDNLDEDLLLELDEVVRDNQLARCPFARSGRAELLLHELDPELAQDIEEERRRRVKELAFRLTWKDDEKKISSSFKTRFGSLDESSGVSPIPDRTRWRPKAIQDEPFTPELRPKDSHTELIFAMDEEVSPGATSPVSPSPQPLLSSERDDLDQLSTLAGSRQDTKRKAIEDTVSPIASPLNTASRPNLASVKSSLDATPKRIPSGANPWGPSALPTSRLDLREVLAESRPTQSALSAGLAAERKDTATKSTPQKISQKERKKQMQQLQAEQAARQGPQSQQSQSPWTKASEKGGSPWQKPTTPSKTSPHQGDDSGAGPSTRPLRPKPLVAAETSSSKSIPRRTASPDTRFSGQRTNSDTRQPAGSSQSTPQQLTPHSKSYIKRAPRLEQEIGLGLADIIGEQQREQQSVREAVAKRSLQEIQQEQAFQEWWDQESRRMQEEEARRTAREEGKDKKKEGGGGRKNRNNKIKGGNNNRGGGSGAGTNRTPEAGPSSISSTRGRGRGNRGRAT